MLFIFFKILDANSYCTKDALSHICFQREITPLIFALLLYQGRCVLRRRRQFCENLLFKIKIKVFGKRDTWESRLADWGHPAKEK